jgi:aldose sugar dehydrogenase
MISIGAPHSGAFTPFGASTGWPIGIAPPNDDLGLAITEGIEDALSVQQAIGLGVWAAGSAGRMPALADKVPDYVEIVNADDAGRRGAHALTDPMAPDRLLDQKCSAVWGETMSHKEVERLHKVVFQLRSALNRFFRVAVALMFISEPGLAADRAIDTEVGQINIQTIAEGLEHPWGLAFLPDGRMLVTERPGRLRMVSKEGQLSQPLEGVPPVFAEGQGGLLDIVLDPDFTSNRFVYISYAEPGEGGASTAVARGRLGDAGLEDIHVIFRQMPKVDGGSHFGSRLVFAPDGKLFITLGERATGAPAQDLSTHLGKIVRINPDGSVPADNPFVGRKDALPEIWSYGHRNSQGAAIHPKTGKLWENELGPMGGDELNIPKAGHNYGWPVVSWGKNYDGTLIPEPPTHPEFNDAIYHWTPVISPSGMTFYTGDAFPSWRGNLLIGGLSSEAIIRLALEGEQVTAEERIPMGTRIRDVVQAQDGSLYALTDEDDGKILRLAPKNAVLLFSTLLFLFFALIIPVDNLLGRLAGGGRRRRMAKLTCGRRVLDVNAPDPIALGFEPGNAILDHYLPRNDAVIEN